MRIGSTVSKTELALLTGYSSKQITRFLETTDIPHAREGNTLAFPWPGVRHWLHQYLEEKGKRAAKPESRDDARERKEYAEAEMAELKLAEARGELMTVEDGRKAIADAFTRVRAKLASFAPRAGAASFGATSEMDATTRLQPLVDEVFAELRTTEDIPTDPEPSDDDDA